MNHRILRFLSIMLVLTLLFGSRAEAAGVTRGSLVSTIISTLELPLWSGTRYFSDISADHPDARAVESAAALGILPPTEKFYPDIETSRAEALMYSLRSLGLAKEAEILSRLPFARNTSLPDYIQPFFRIAQTIEPKPPEVFLLRPAQALEINEIPALRQWLSACRRYMVWKERFDGSRTSLILQRENIGRPPASWGVQAGVFPAKSQEAEALKRKIEGRGLPCTIEEQPSGRTVLVGPFLHYVEAWAKADQVKDIGETRIVPFEDRPSEALFWSAIVADTSRTMPRIVTAGEIAGRKQPLSWIAQHSEAEGAVNGGFFNGVHIIGSLVSRGFPVNEPWQNRSAIGWDDNGTFHFGPGRFRATLRSGGETLEIARHNSVPAGNEAALYSPHIWYFASGIPDDALEGTVVSGRLTGIRGAHLSNHFVPRNGYLVVARGFSANRLRHFHKGETIDLELSWHDKGFEKCTNVLQAGPLLLQGGKGALTPEGFSESIIRGRHPRSIAGTDGTNLWWIVVDGRDSWHSRGCTLEEAAALSAGFGLEEALNLDGGGSSTMWWQGALVNSPSGTSERPLPYAVVF
ncbi:MAG: phosphodiester glycosidase family protein [Thermovirgaceae bacterium]